nr:MAG TPA: hypothetical protein [Caudoviricetes sp.]
MKKDLTSASTHDIMKYNMRNIPNIPIYQNIPKVT